MTSTLLLIVTLLVTIEFLYIMYLETFATTSSKTSKVFGISQEKLAEKEVTNLFKNQGIYNGLLGLGLVYGLIFQPNLIPIIFVYIVLVAIYGALTVHPKILFIQGGLAFLGLIFSLLS